MGNNIAIYPGTFDPITNGHVDIIKRGLKIFDKLIVVVADNFEKKPLFSIKERLDMINKVTRGLNVEVDQFNGLLVDFLKQKKCNTMIRSLRAVSDFDYEFQMAVLNKDLNPKLETVFLMTNKEFFYLSSSIVKGLYMSGGNADHLVPEYVSKKLKSKIVNGNDR